MSSLTQNWPEDYQERCKSLFNNDILSDVKFVVRASQHGDCSDSKRSKMVISAHKFLLSIRSPVFFAMFCGKMAETKENIDLPDCEYEGMLELLRYIYTDEVCLTESNVMQVAYLAAKYMIPCLAKKCANYLGQKLDLSNVFGILKHAEHFRSEYLLMYCWHYIEQMTKDIVKLSEFLTMERSFLESLVEEEELNIREVELFKAVNCWAEKECERQKLKADDPTKRAILGEQIIKNLRFPAMKSDEFLYVVMKTNILTQEETSDIIKFFESPVTPPDGFLVTERDISLLGCCRYNNSCKTVICNNDPSIYHPVKLTVDKDILLRGIAFWATESDLHAAISITVNVYLANKDSDSMLSSQTEQRKVEDQENAFCSYHGFDFVFRKPIPLKKNVQYYVAVSTDWPDVSLYYGSDGVCDSVECGGVTFNFDNESTLIAEFLFTLLWCCTA